MILVFDYIIQVYYELKDNPIIMKDNTAMVSVEFLIEYFDILVSFDEENNLVEIQKPEGILLYKLPKELGMPRLTEEEIKDLIGKDPEVIQQKIATAYDLLHYMKLSGYYTDSDDTTIREGDYIWHHNKNGRNAVLSNEGNCGGTASFVNYLLKDDYDEVGFMVYSATQGGHVFNYIKHNDKYYVIDFLQYVMSDYERYNYGGDVVSNLKDYVELCKKNYASNKDIQFIVYYQAEDVLPIANKREGDNRVMMYYPKGTNVIPLYETPSENVELKFVNSPRNIPDIK